MRPWPCTPHWFLRRETEIRSRATEWRSAASWNCRETEARPTPGWAGWCDWWTLVETHSSRSQAAVCLQTKVSSIQVGSMKLRSWRVWSCLQQFATNLFFNYFWKISQNHFYLELWRKRYNLLYSHWGPLLCTENKKVKTSYGISIHWERGVKPWMEHSIHSLHVVQNITYPNSCHSDLELHWKMQNRNRSENREESWIICRKKVMSWEWNVSMKFGPLKVREVDDDNSLMP